MTIPHIKREVLKIEYDHISSAISSIHALADAYSSNRIACPVLVMDSIKAITTGLIRGGTENFDDVFYPENESE